MLREDPKVPATVVCQRLRRDGFDGEITILKDLLRQVRPRFVAAAGFQRTSYRHGEICQVDYWHTGIDVPVGKGAVRESLGGLDDEVGLACGCHAHGLPAAEVLDYPSRDRR